MEFIGIGQLASRAGVSIDTVRYYERSGLLSPQARLASGYRRYSGLQVSRLRFIRRAQELGFSLKDIRELLGLSQQRDVARVKRAAEKKLAEVKERLEALTRVRDGLATLVATCPGHGRAADCPILKALGEESPQRAAPAERLAC
jgi:MerR family copper efflux transcriptional regulator